MSSYLPVKNFEVSIEKIEDSNIVYLVFKINDYNYFRFPYHNENIQTVLVENFKHIVNGKEKNIDLNFDLNYNIWNGPLEDHQENEVWTPLEESHAAL